MTSFDRLDISTCKSGLATQSNLCWMPTTHTGCSETKPRWPRRESIVLTQGLANYWPMSCIRPINIF